MSYRCEHGVSDDGCAVPCPACGHACESHPMDFCIECGADCIPPKSTIEPGEPAGGADGASQKRQA